MLWVAFLKPLMIFFSKPPSPIFISYWSLQVMLLALHPSAWGHSPGTLRCSQGVKGEEQGLRKL